ncbi:tyrosine-type recombinase/integrase [Bergeyella sp. RCAD1439]|uniref:tyrosine-type recombinase/integrase n=1 Tax=Bergeyella anatis TaxID=3113737 RepID=UPI002E16DD2C|nr:tyrosine-type recombinase/integrase [Bergeyella sp. RCAD1439]
MKLEQYLQENYKTKGLKTLIKRFTDYQNGKEKTATPKEILQYIEYLRKQNLNPKTLRNNLFAIKIYYRYLQETDQRKDHPCLRLNLKDKVNRSIATEKLYSKQELEDLLENHNPKDKKVKTRNQVIISLLINQALLVKEITELKLKDINLETAEIYIAKGGKTNARKLPLKANQILLFQNYSEERKILLNHTKKESEHFVLSKFGTPLNPHGISRLINEGKPKEERIQPLKIRQSVTLNLLKSGNDLRVVQIFIGHRRSSSTEEYKQTDLEILQNAVNQFHPRK